MTFLEICSQCYLWMNIKYPMTKVGLLVAESAKPVTSPTENTNKICNIPSSLLTCY